jgi:hypothetical protein
MRRIEQSAIRWEGTRVEPVVEKKRVREDAEPLEEEEPAAQKSERGRTH